MHYLVILTNMAAAELLPYVSTEGRQLGQNSLPSKWRSAIKGKSLLPTGSNCFLFTVDSLSEGPWCGRKAKR